MLKKMISGLCVISMVGCLMVGCTSEESVDENTNSIQMEENNETNQNNKDLDKAYELVKNKLEDTEKESGSDLLGQYGEDELIKKDDTLVLKLIYNEDMNEDIVNLPESDWNGLVDDFQQIPIIIEEYLNEENIDVPINVEFYVYGSDMMITKIDRDGIIESHYNEYKSSLQPVQSEQVEPIEPEVSPSDTAQDGQMYSVSDGIRIVSNYIAENMGEEYKWYCEETAQGPDDVFVEVYNPDESYWGYIEINLWNGEIILHQGE